MRPGRGRRSPRRPHLPPALDWRAWLGRLPWVIAAVLVTDLMVAGLTLHQKPTYQASTVINTGVSSGTSLSGAPTDWFRAGVLIANIEEILRSRTVLDGTIRLLGIRTTPERLTKRLAIGRINQTDLIKITADAGSARDAASLANAHVASFLQAWERMEGEGAHMALDFAREQMDKAAERLRNAEGRLKRFRSAALPESRAATSQRAADLTTQEADLERQLMAARAGLKAAEREIARRSRASTGGAPASDVVTAGERLRRIERNLQDARQNRDPATPDLEIQVRAARGALASAAARAGAEPALADAMARSVALLVEIAQHEAQLSFIHRERTDAVSSAQKAEAEAVTYAELQREVAMREADYRALAERAGQARLTADSISRSPIRIVDQAAPPDKPASRKLPLKVALGTLVAAIATLGVLHVRDVLATSWPKPEWEPPARGTRQERGPSELAPGKDGLPPAPPWRPEEAT